MTLPAVLPAEPSAPPVTPSHWSQLRARFARHHLATAALYLLAVLYFVAIFAEFFALEPPQWRVLQRAYCPPQLPRISLKEGLYVPAMRLIVDPVTLRKSYVEDPSRPVHLGFFVRGAPYRLWGVIPWDRHFFGPVSIADQAEGFYFLGADRYGEDLASRLIYGSRISLSIGLAAIAVTSVLGITIGGISGYAGGGVDNFIQQLIEVLSAFPQVPLWLAFGAILPPDWSPVTAYFAITLVLSLLAWTGLARVVRGKILALREEDYATAARLLGASHTRVLFRHLLPGAASHIIAVVALSIPAMILGETSLSFLGLGLRPPVVSWGVMLQDCMSLQVVADYPWLLMPVIFVVLTVLGFNFLGEGLREAADPYAL